MLAADELVGEGADGGPGDRRDDVDPEVVHFTRDQRRADRAGGVHRGAGDRAAEEGVEADRAADRDRRSRPDRAGVGRDGHDREHQEGGQHHLVDDRAAGADAGQRRAEVRRLARPDRQQQRRGRDRAEQLGGDVGERLATGEVAGEGEGERHRRVEVGAGEVAGRVDHRHDHQAEDERDADGAEHSGVHRVGDDRPAAGEDEGEGAESLGGGATGEVRATVHRRTQQQAVGVASDSTGTATRAGTEKTSRTASSAPGTRLK